MRLPAAARKRAAACVAFFSLRSEGAGAKGTRSPCLTYITSETPRHSPERRFHSNDGEIKECAAPAVSRAVRAYFAHAAPKWAGRPVRPAFPRRPPTGRVATRGRWFAGQTLRL